MSTSAPSAGPPSAGPTRLLSRSAVLRRLELEVNRRLDGLVAGDHLVAAAGPGSERAGARAYEPGDDARRIDWSLSARSLQPHVRTTDADRELETVAVVDRSASLDFGTSQREKREVALAALAAIGVVTVRGGNRLATVIAGGDRLSRLPARHDRVGVMAALSAVYDTPRRTGAPAPAADLAAALRTVARSQRRRGQVVVISDFLGGTEWVPPMRQLSLRHQVIAVHVTDPRELRLAPVGMLTVVDSETGRHLHVQTNSSRLRTRFAEAAQARQAAIRAAIGSAGAEYLHLSTDRDWVLDLARFVSRRAVTRTARGRLQ